MRIPIVDVFAGPGGLGEGLSSLRTKQGRRAFEITLSIEKDPIAYQTLLLRNFFRFFPTGEVPKDYYLKLQQKIDTKELFSRHPRAAMFARSESWNATLGDDSSAPLGLLRKCITTALEHQSEWVLIGGPPCQAYSLVGRARNKGVVGYSLAEDPKARLYLEYLQIIGDFWPSVFVMENVKGLLSSKIEGELVFDRICQDLRDPADAMARNGRMRQKRKKHTYKLCALTLPKPKRLKIPVLARLSLFIYFPRRFLLQNAMVRSHASFAAAAS
ncbi:MAG: DNA cytosine methyltransferase [Burkholderiales bacterium]